MKLTFEAKKNVAGGTFMEAVRTSFQTRDWMQIAVTVNNGVRYILGEIGHPSAMMHELTDLSDGGTIEVEIPDNIEFDVEEVRAKLAEVVDNSFDLGVRALGQQLEEIGGSGQTST
jgi:hypothetical protein